MSTLFDLMYSQGFKAAMDSVERLLVEHAMLRHQGNTDQAARAIRLNRTTLVMKRRKFGMLEPSTARKFAKRKLTPRIQSNS